MGDKRGIFKIIFLLSLLLILPLASAEVIINKQPAPVYNFGDLVTIQITFKPVQAVAGNFQMDLLCGTTPVNFYRNGISALAGDEKVIESSLVLQRDIIGENKGRCKIKAYLGSDFALTNEFLISDLIMVNSTLPKEEFSPDENILIKGSATKENGQPSNGYVELSIFDENTTTVIKKSTVNNGVFSINITFPKNLRSGNYILKVFAYEEDLSGQMTNKGFLEEPIFVKQVPTSLEIVFENPDTEIKILPGTNLKVKAVLHDQTGINIDSVAFITIKNGKGKILEQRELPTNEFLEFPIAYNEPPSSWKVVAVSNKITSEASFDVLEKESAEIKIENKTILITNTGNIPYNKTVLVKIGNQSLNIDVYLEVGESQRWLLTAPNGEYNVLVAVDGKSTNSSVVLTGDAINIKKASSDIVSITKFPAVWIFIIAILGLMTFIVFKRGYKKAFMGHISSDVKNNKSLAEIATFVSSQKSKAEMVLSIKGDKQEVCMVTLKIKNMAWVKNTKEGNASEVLQKIIDLAKEHKAVTYESGDNLFFILAPIRTRTFKNEENALKLATKIKEILDNHNKLFRQKIDFGISLNIGEVIAKQDPDGFKFMGLGNFMPQSKKIASIANKEILIGEKMNDKIKTIAKTEKHEHEGINTYSIKEIKDIEKHKKFLQGFMKRQGDGK